MPVELTQLTPPKELTPADKNTIFQHFNRRLAAYRNNAELYADAECHLSPLPEEKKGQIKDEYTKGLNDWANGLLEQAWIACGEPEEKSGVKCPKLDIYSDTSTVGLPKLPPQEELIRVINTILFLHVTTSKQYSARTRCFLSSFGTLNEEAIVAALKNPESAIEQAQKQAQETTEAHASRGRTLRYIGMGAGAVLGGVLVGVTGGLAAPLVGGAASAVLGLLGVGGTAAGLLASGLAGSAAVCGALFGVYGAQSTASMIHRHTREVRDLDIVPVGTHPDEETLALRLCVSGWLSSEEEITAPWTIFGGDDTFALRWEVKALRDLSNALVTLVGTNAMKFVGAQVVQRTVLAPILAALAPTAWLKVGQIIDNPWSNAKALAVKTGAVLGELLAKRVFGNRPLTLTGYSLGSLVIFEALKYLTTLPPSQTSHLIQDVFLFGTPADTNPSTWASFRRLVCGRIVNGYSNGDYVLGILSRASTGNWKVAGLEPVDAIGVESELVGEVIGHTKWRGLIGKALKDCGAPGVLDEQIELQLKTIAQPMEQEMNINDEEAKEIIEKGM
ncbi:duf726 domain-containing protein [Moniliophthora roreri MCA 2997]|uniref:Duf726 domain-containing protein n=2 Tax=Moniliophthora roreri TaxID=221103 RepID=V2XNT7_MONRO|nr:duf726 domain-containing protein [Moniliophthora roreri MCA 2997]KAI3610791.1 duf726 domain-containing protein [Moniliophthora roreri]